MATLSVDDLSLEVAYNDFRYGWVHYDIRARWRGVPVFNEEVIRHESDEKTDRRDAIKACEYRECGLLPLLRRVLERNDSDYWEALEPDILFAFQTDRRFPFLKPKSSRNQLSSTLAQEALQQEQAVRILTEDDTIETMLLIDTHSFTAGYSYSGQGVCFRLLPTRKCLRQFYEGLRGEYLGFKDVHAVDAYNQEDEGEDYKEPWF